MRAAHSLTKKLIIYITNLQHNTVALLIFDRYNSWLHMLMETTAIISQPHNI